MPDKIPDIRGAPEAKAMPKQRGRATKKTTILAIMSWRIVVSGFIGLCLSGLRWELSNGLTLFVQRHTHLAFHLVINYACYRV